MNPDYDFEGQVALVTGASSGMGLTTAEAFAQAGAAVVLADVNETALSEVTNDLTTAGHRALGVACDVSDERQVAAMVERAVGEFGRLDMAFNNAACASPRSWDAFDASIPRMPSSPRPSTPARGFGPVSLRGDGDEPCQEKHPCSTPSCASLPRRAV